MDPMRFIEVTVRNSEEEEDCPPFGCMAITSWEDDDGYLVAVVRRPIEADVLRSDPSRFLFNGGEVLPAGLKGRGLATLPHAQALIDTSDTYITVDQYKSFVGPKENSWALGRGVCWEIIGKDETLPHEDGDLKTYWVQTLMTRCFVGQTGIGGIDETSGGEVNVYTLGASGWTLSGVVLDAKTKGSALEGEVDCLIWAINGCWFALEIC